MRLAPESLDEIFLKLWRTVHGMVPNTYAIMTKIYNFDISFHLKCNFCNLSLS